MKEFSGLDRGIIIGVDLKVNLEYVDFNKFILSLAIRVRDKFVIIFIFDDI